MAEARTTGPQQRGCTPRWDLDFQRPRVAAPNESDRTAATIAAFADSGYGATLLTLISQSTWRSSPGSTASPRLRRGFAGGRRIEGVDGLEAKAGHAMLDQIGPHHPLCQAGLPSLIHHVPATCKVRGQAFQHQRKRAVLFGGPTLCMPQRKAVVAGLGDAPDADAAVPSMLLEDARPGRSDREQRGPRDRAGPMSGPGCDEQAAGAQGRCIDRATLRLATGCDAGRPARSNRRTRASDAIARNGSARHSEAR
jgi:hypothetical protein